MRINDAMKSVKGTHLLISNVLIDATVMFLSEHLINSRLMFTML